MIIDNIKNIDLYAEIPAFAKEFIKNLSPEIAEGRYELPNNCYANVESYLTKTLNNGAFEAHKNYIDIQLLISGKERIYYSELEGLNVNIPYDLSRDIMFFADKIDSSDFLTLNGTNFALIYPHEAHAPQIAVELPKEVKKVVLKIKI